MLKNLVGTFIALQLIGLASPALADSKLKVDAKIISDRQNATPGETLWLGLSMQVERGWHVYWKNPGDTGLPTRLQWTNDGGFKIGEIQWPAPHRIAVKDLVNLGYEDEILLPMSAQVPASAKPGDTIQLEADAKWLVCREACVPEKAHLTLKMPIVAGQSSKSDVAGFFAQTRDLLPASGDGWDVNARVDGGELLIDVKPKFPVAKGWSKGLEILPEEKGIVRLNPAASVTETDAGAQIAFKMQEGKSIPATAKELAFVATSDAAWSVSKDAKAKAVRWVASVAPAAGAPEEAGSLANILFFAFIGGLILNLMPCVFPVLSIKVLEIVDSSSDSAGLKLRGWLYSLGVMASFWFLAGVMILLKEGGKQVGWGFQLQSPAFVAALMVLFLLIGLNLLGVFEVATRLMGVGGSAGGAEKSSGVAAAFATGVLSVVVASPCTAPFMGVALGFALGQSSIVTVLVFSALGAGLASPFLAITFFPSIAKHLPRPGAWMGTFKKALAFPMFATVSWLVWVFEQQTGSGGLIRALLALVLISTAAWLYGDFAQMGRTAKTRIRGSVLSLVFAGLAVWGITEGVLAREKKSEWETFSTAHVQELRKQGVPVFVDYTAAWCITCQANERAALTSDVLAQLLKAGVHLVRADWTTEDEEITTSLRSFGRSGVPLYVFYPKNGEPKVLPQVLTPGMVLDLAK